MNHKRQEYGINTTFIEEQRYEVKKHTEIIEVIA